MPKPPPTSGVTTRNFSGGSLKTLPASSSFTSQEPWVPQCRVNLPSRLVVLGGRGAALHAGDDDAVVHHGQPRHVRGLARSARRPSPCRRLPSRSRCCSSMPSQTLRRAGLVRFGEVGDGGQQVVVHHHRLGAVARRLRGLGDDEGDGVADMAHPVRRPARRAASRRGRCRRVFFSGMMQGISPRPSVLPLLRGDDGEHAGHFQRAARCRSTGSSPRRAAIAGRSHARPRPARCRPCSARRPSAGAGPRCGASAGSARTWPWSSLQPVSPIIC